MVGVLTILGGVLLIILESVFLRIFGVRVLTPHLGVILVAYVAVRRSFTMGAATTLLYAAVGDLCAGGPRGFFALGLTITFFAGRLFVYRYRLQRGIAIVLAIGPLVLINDILSLSAMLLFRRGDAPMASLLPVAPVSAIIAMLFALPLVWIFSRVDRALERQDYQSVPV